MRSSKYIENIHYYLEEGRVVFTALFHLERGWCCGNGCRNCVYEPVHDKFNRTVQDKYLATKEEIDIFKDKLGYDKTQS